MPNVPNSPRIALLIDADNVQLDHLPQILAVARSYGKLKIRRAYGDWTQPRLSAYSEKVDSLHIARIPVPRIGKDNSDKRLIIEACEILCKNQADLFIIVSGDADFRQLCEYIKQEGLKAVGIGNKGQSSDFLQKTCDVFHYVEELDETLFQLEQSRLQGQFADLLFRALRVMPTDKEGWVSFVPLGIKLRELDPDFNNRFGSRKLSAWLRGVDGQFDIKGQKVRVSVR